MIEPWANKPHLVLPIKSTIFIIMIEFSIMEIVECCKTNFLQTAPELEHPLLAYFYFIYIGGIKEALEVT